ncbi:hypothetical protein FRC12_011852 [Ceratobasidium sp. 428]|nr:hypothetical protein FRC12_011852 [Ceratobasidium sp. 428]
MERTFQSSSSTPNNISLKFPEAAHTSDNSMSQSTSEIPASFLRPPVDIRIDMHTSAFPTGMFSAQLFCNMITARPHLQRASITRIDWLQKNEGPMYHQYLLVEISHSARTYILRIETLGKIDRHRTAVQTLALSVLGAGSGGDSKYQVHVTEQISGVVWHPDYERVKQGSDKLILSIANEDDRLHRELASEWSSYDRWYYSFILPYDYSQAAASGVETPKLKNLCLILCSVLQRAPDYKLQSFNCYFLCRIIILGILRSCVPLPRLTWSDSFTRSLTQIPTGVSWYRQLWSPKSRIIANRSCVLQVDNRYIRRVEHIVYQKMLSAHYLEPAFFRVLTNIMWTIQIVSILSVLLFKPKSFFPAIIAILVCQTINFGCITTWSSYSQRKFLAVQASIFRDIGLTPQQP